MSDSRLELVIAAEQQGKRLDQTLAMLLPQHSRARIQAWIKGGHVEINGRPPRQRDPVQAGDTVVIHVPPVALLKDAAEPMPLRLVHEDASLLVLDKPAGLVVHPAAGHAQGTLLNALLHHCPALSAIPRAGIVHRLDRDTSGLLVVAKTEAARLHLVRALKNRSMGREYLALVSGTPISGGSVDAAIGRDPHHRTRMAVVRDGRPSVTHYRIEQRFRAHSLLRVTLESGRTHQIRVHLAHVRLPVFGDPVYAGRFRLPPRASEAFITALRGFHRQALHATRLTLIHPETGRSQRFESPVPEDMKRLLALLKTDLRLHGDP